jgi:NADH-quinone oxidoreductase subunit N
MSSSALVSLLPLIVLAAGTVVILVVVAFYRSHTLTALLCLVTQVLALSAIFIADQNGSQEATSLLFLDGYAYFFIGLLIAASLVVALLSYGYLKAHDLDREEFYLLLLTATLGASVLASSSHFVSFFLGLEILSISLYALIGYFYAGRRSVEAGVKYLVLAATSSAFLLFGMALIYADTGTMEFARIFLAIASGNVSLVYIYTGIVLVVIGIGFKLALVPFHMWTADVYEGAPAPVTAFVASVSKGSVFALLVHLFSRFDLAAIPSLLAVFTWIAIFTMLIGNFLALRQNNVKRLLAYSSIANLGYLLVAFIAHGSTSIIASTFFLVTYFVTILAAFGIIAALSGKERDADHIEDYRGLMWRNPWLAAAFTAAMLSLAGIPLTAGFLGKFYVVAAGVESSLWLPVLVLVISSGIGIYYYLRVVVMMFSHPEETLETPAATLSLSLSGKITLVILILAVIWLGVYPSPLLHIIQLMTTGFN